MVNVARRQTKSFDINKRQSRFYDCMRSAKSFASKHKIITVIIIIILTFLIGRKLIAWQDYQKFKKAEIYISDIAKKVAESDQPDEQVRIRNCAYQTQVYSRGERYCAVGFKLIYANKTVEQANEVVVNTISGSDGFFSPSQSEESMKFTLNNRNQQIDIMNSIEALDSCKVIYRYYQQTLSDNERKLMDLELSVECTSRALFEHYPRRF